MAPLAVKLIDWFKQITAGFGAIVTVGFGTTDAVAFTACELHPKLPPITLYTVVTAGFAITLGPFGVFNVAAGLHVKVEALFAVKVTCVPAHMLPLVAVMVGFGYTVNVYTAAFVQVPAVPITDIVATNEVVVKGAVTVIGLLVELGLPAKPGAMVHE